ncbi:MAG: hypothetical protein Q9174_006287, partial [Haloplaca sp. 1 TL-2023]
LVGEAELGEARAVTVTPVTAPPKSTPVSPRQAAVPAIYMGGEGTPAQAPGDLWGSLLGGVAGALVLRFFGVAARSYEKLHSSSRTCMKGMERCRLKAGGCSKDGQSDNVRTESGKRAWEIFPRAKSPFKVLPNLQFEDLKQNLRSSTIGPNAMLKMLLDPMGGIALTNDGHAILREIEVAHPAAKNMIELSRTQDEEVGDGTTTVIILAGEILAQALPQLERNIHPVVIISAFKRALSDALNIVGKVSIPVNVNDDEQMYRLISSAIDTKYAARWSKMMCSIALKAVRTVSHDAGGGKKEVDIKRYAKVEKVPGSQIEDSRVLDGVMLNKDITHPKMRRKIDNPRVVLLDCPLEYKKGESQTNIEISKEDDWNRILQIEEEQVKAMTDAIISVRPDVVITEKGVSDLAQHFLVKHNITALRRVRKTDNNRIARATGATIVNRVEDLRESDVGTQCGLFEIEKIGDEYFTFITKCKGPKACTILLRGPSKDILNEIERNLQDAMYVARNVVFHPRLSPGGGATEMAVS